MRSLSKDSLYLLDFVILQYEKCILQTSFLMTSTEIINLLLYITKCSKYSIQVYENKYTSVKQLFFMRYVLCLDQVKESQKSQQAAKLSILVNAFLKTPIQKRQARAT